MDIAGAGAGAGAGDENEKFQLRNTEKQSTHFSLVMPDNIERTLVQAFQVDCGLVQAQLGMLPEILTN